jgi:hypothetical protein
MLHLLFEFELLFTASKLRHFSDVKLGISIPVRGESSELLNADGEKNDYDWYVVYFSYSNAFDFPSLSHYINLMVPHVSSEAI